DSTAIHPSLTGQSSYHAGGCDLSYGVIAHVRHEDITFTIHRHTPRVAKLCIGIDAVFTAGMPGKTGQRAHDSGRCDFSNHVVGSVSHINIASTIHGNIVWQPKLSLDSDTISVAASP